MKEQKADRRYIYNRNLVSILCHKLIMLLNMKDFFQNSNQPVLHKYEHVNRNGMEQNKPTKKIPKYKNKWSKGGRKSWYISSPANSKINFKFNNYAVVTRQPLDGGASAAYSATGLRFPAMWMNVQ